MAIARDVTPLIGVAKLFNIEEVYGVRHACCLMLPCPALSFCFSLRRSVDPARMTERERRNRFPEEDIYSEVELLVHGHFHEDEDDTGFKATRWVPWSEVDQVEAEEDDEPPPKEAFLMLSNFVANAKPFLIADVV